MSRTSTGSIARHSVFHEPGETLDRGALKPQLPGGPRDGRPPRREQRRVVLYERLPWAVGLTAPPHHPHLRHPGHITEQPSAPTVRGHEHTATKAPRRVGTGRDRHVEDVVATIDVLDVDSVKAQQQVAAGTRTVGRACVSVSRSRVKHVEVLVS